MRFAQSARSVLAMTALPVLLALATGCSLFQDDEEQLSAEEQYAEATEFSKNGDVEKAIESYNNLISTYPQSRHAQQAQLDIVYEYYRVRRYEEAINAAERFISEYPGHSKIDYAHYMVGLSHFREDIAFFDRLGNEDPAERDPRAMLAAYDTFSALVEQYPNSIYYNDSVQRLRFLINTLAKHEAIVARYYLWRRAWIAAAGRANYILEHYPDSKSNEEALAILVATYQTLELEKPRKNALRLLEINYPESILLEPAKEGAAALLKTLDPSRYQEDWLFSKL